MPEFIPEHCNTVVNDFIRGYLECAEWLADNGDAPQNANSKELSDEKRKKIKGFTKASLRRAEKDCAEFIVRAGNLLTEYENSTGRDMVSAGHDFLLTRNHHGAGFWDRGDHPCLTALTDIAHEYGEIYCSVYKNYMHIEG